MRMPKKNKKNMTKQDGWISVKKNLPPKDGNYLVTIVPDGRPEDAYVCFADFKDEEGCFTTDNDYGESVPIDNYGRVISWMTKPKPFKE